MIDLQTVLTYLTLISVPVGVVYHIMTLRNTRRNQELQLETRQAQMFSGIMARANTAERRKALSTFLYTNWSNFEEFLEWIDPFNPEYSQNFDDLNLIFGHYEYMGVLVREGLVGIRLVALAEGGAIRSMWEKIAPFIDDFRDALHAPRYASEWEYLYNELVKYVEEHPELR